MKNVLLRYYLIFTFFCFIFIRNPNVIQRLFGIDLNLFSIPLLFFFFFEAKRPCYQIILWCANTDPLRSSQVLLYLVNSISVPSGYHFWKLGNVIILYDELFLNISTHIGFQTTIVFIHFCSLSYLKLVPLQKWNKTDWSFYNLSYHTDYIIYWRRYNVHFI